MEGIQKHFQDFWTTFFFHFSPKHKYVQRSQIFHILIGGQLGSIGSNDSNNSNDSNYLNYLNGSNDSNDYYGGGGLGSIFRFLLF